VSNSSILQALAAWLAAGETRIGELIIQIQPRDNQPAQYDLRHHVDAGLGGLTLHTLPAHARPLALYDTTGAYRPLKSAPTLPRGWHFLLTSLQALLDTIDIFYPAALPLRLAHQQHRLAITPLRDTLARQSGMYAITRKLTDPQAQSLIASTCDSQSACLKTILWPLSPGNPITSLPPDKFNPSANPHTIPLLCLEPCNILVARAREVVKQAPPPSAQSSAKD
jgi:sirohydrochlorin cobaltochelatase